MKLDIIKYLGIKYDANSIFGLNCWGLYIKVIRDHFGNIIDKSSILDITKTHKKIDKPVDFCLVLLTKNDKKGGTHCGVWYNNSILNAKGHGNFGQVFYERLDAYKSYNCEFFIHESIPNQVR